MVEVYNKPLKTRYLTSYCSNGFVFSILCYIGLFIIPYFIGYTSYNFWKKIEYYREHPIVHSTKDYILYYQGKSGSSDMTGFYSTFPEMNKLIDSSILKLPTTSMIKEEDYNLDSNPQFIYYKICIPLKSDEYITSIKFMTFFTVNLTQLVVEDFTSMVYLQYDSPIAGSELNSYGHLMINQVNPLNIKSRRHMYSEPMVNRTGIFDVQDFLFENYLLSNLYRNETLSYTNQNNLWKTTTSGVAQSFTLNINFRVPEQNIQYVPPVSETVKFAYVQYVAIFALFYWLLNKAMKFIYTQQVVSTLVVTDGRTYERNHFHSE